LQTTNIEVYMAKERKKYKEKIKCETVWLIEEEGYKVTEAARSLDFPRVYTTDGRLVFNKIKPLAVVVH